jgi:hypothetical protein
VGRGPEAYSSSRSSRLSLGSRTIRTYSRSATARACSIPFSQRKQELDETLKIAPWVIHDLRRTSRKLMTRAGVRPDIAELALGHSIKGIQAVYDDAVEYGPMINHALQCVSNEIEKILNPPKGNVVAIADADARKKRKRR